MKTFKELVPVFAFAVIALLFCFPQLQGKKLSQSDNVQWKCMAREAMAYHDSTGKDVLWSNSMYGGMPTYTCFVGATNTNYPALLQNALELIGKPAYFFFIYMLGFYLLMLAMGIEVWVGTIGAVAYAFATFNVVIISAGHETQALSLGYLPAAFAGLYMIFHGRKLTGAAMLSLFMALIAANNHYQVMFYVVLIFLGFGISMLVTALRQKQIKDFLLSAGIALLAGVIGLGPNLPSMLITHEYANSTIRGGKSELAIHDKKKNGGLDKETAFLWSSSIGESFVSLVPYLYGGASYETADKAPNTASIMPPDTELFPVYWGPQPYQQGPVYFGAVVCFLFILGFFTVQSHHKWWILAVSLFGFLMSLGNNFKSFNYFLFDHIPFVNMFRAVTMAKVIPQFLFLVLGIMSVQSIYTHTKQQKEKLWKNIWVTGSVMIGFCLLLGLGGKIFFNFTTPTDSGFQSTILDNLKQDRIALALNSCIRSAGLILVVCIILWAFIQDKVTKTIFIGALGLIVAIDLLPVAHNYLNDKNYADEADYKALFEPREIDKTIMKDPDPYYRVLDLSSNPFTNATQAYFHKCVGGNNPAIMEKYNDLIQRQMINGFNAEVVNMLNTKYIIIKGTNGEPILQVNPDACGNAWFVNEVHWVENDEDAMNALKARHLGDTTIVPNPFRPKVTAVVRTKFKKDLDGYKFGKDTAAYVKLDKYGLDDISFVSANSQDGLAVFSDIYYSKGWKAYIDGKETPIVKADYVLRAIKVPAGNHKIEFHFRPDSFYHNQPIALASSIVLILLCLGALAVAIKQHLDQPKAPLTVEVIVEAVKTDIPAPAKKKKRK